MRCSSDVLKKTSPLDVFGDVSEKVKHLTNDASNNVSPPALGDGGDGGNFDDEEWGGDVDNSDDDQVVNWNIMHDKESYYFSLGGLIEEE